MGFLNIKSSNVTAVTLNLNLNAFRDLGGEFIISAIPLSKANSELLLLKKFTHPHSAWDIYLYSVE